MLWWRGRGEGEIVCCGGGGVGVKGRLLWWWRGRGEGEIVCCCGGEVGVKGRLFVCCGGVGVKGRLFVCCGGGGVGVKGRLFVCCGEVGVKGRLFVCLYFLHLPMFLQAESEVAACMKKMFMGLSFPKPPDNITASVLFDKLEKKVEQEPS